MDEELERASEALGNHALAINLLANWLRAIPGHPIAKAHDVPDLDIPPEKGRHPRRVMVAFAERFGERSAEVEALRLLGLFDRPATKAAIDALRRPPPIPGLTDHGSELDEAGWLNLLERLREVGLIAPASSHAPEEVDAHPLMREHFGQELRAKHPDAWRAGHARLYKYFKDLPQKDKPDTLEEMAPLFRPCPTAVKRRSITMRITMFIALEQPAITRTTLCKKLAHLVQTCRQPVASLKVYGIARFVNFTKEAEIGSSARLLLIYARAAA